MANNGANNNFLLTQAKIAGELAEKGELENLVIFCRKPLFNSETLIQLLQLPTDEKFGETILHRAAYAGHVNVVRFLLEIGADPSSSVSNLLSTPLHSAAAGGSEEVVRILINKIKLRSKKPEKLINSLTNTKWTPFHSAIARQNFNIAKILVENGADFNCPNRHFNSREIYLNHLSEIISLENNNNNNNNNNNVVNNNIVNNDIDKVLNIGGVSIQIASDLHIEFYGEEPIDYTEIIKPSAPILALLGDIGIPFANNNYNEFLLHLSFQFQLVLVIAGNHEYYNQRGREKKSYEEIKEKIREICSQRKNIIFMDKTSLFINGVRILGTSLWSFIPPFAQDICDMSLNDYNLIYIDPPLNNNNDDNIMIEDNNNNDKGGWARENTNGKIRLTPNVSSKWYEEEANWIRHEVGESMKRGEESVVILTHHTPSFFGTSGPSFDTHPWRHHFELNSNDRIWTNCCFSSDLEYLFANYNNKVGNTNVKLWAYGHTHHNNDQIIYGTRIVSNQRGYIPNFNKTYSPNFVVCIK